jgi:hypothetical protein
VAERRHLREILGNARIVAWVCPIESHGDRRGVVTVEWDADDVAHCTYRGCTFTSLTPPPLEDMPPLYHWSPTERRPRINRYGLRVGQPPVTHTEEFRAPYLCFAETPSWAWALSGMRDERKPREPGSWDLWQVNVNGKRGETVATYDDDHRWHEVRVHETLRKKRLLYLATREIK